MPDATDGIAPGQISPPASPSVREKDAWLRELLDGHPMRTTGLLEWLDDPTLRKLALLKLKGHSNAQIATQLGMARCSIEAANWNGFGSSGRAAVHRISSNRAENGLCLECHQIKRNPSGDGDEASLAKRWERDQSGEPRVVEGVSKRILLYREVLQDEQYRCGSRSNQGRLAEAVLGRTHSGFVSQSATQVAQARLPPLVTVRLFLLQILRGNVPCDEMPHAAQMCFSGQAYCKARARWPRAVLEGLLRITVESLGKSALQGSRWLGHRVFLVDGSSFSMPDTPALQTHFGQPGNQAPGCGFPVAHWLAMMHYGTGMVVGS